MKQDSKALIFQNSIFARISVATLAILIVPLIAMQFTSEVSWRLADFIAMGVLLSGMASLFVLVARRVPRRYRLLLGVMFAVAFLFIWAELAVGVFTNLAS